MADTLASAYLTAKVMTTVWDAQHIGDLIPNDPTVIDDGAQSDGRSVITNAQVNAIVQRARELITWLERGSLDGTGQQNFSFLSSIVAVQVNPQSRV